MPKITANLLGNPIICKDSQQIFLPFRKVEALLYYLLVKKQASRDVVVDLLWGDTGEEVAKKNLRNAVYLIRKAFDEEVIVSPRRPVLMLNPDIEFQVDVDLLAASELHELDKIYKGDFLEGFLIKGADYYDQWMLETREQYQGLFIEKAKLLIDEYTRRKDYAQAEKYCKILLRTDEFNEDVHRLLMRIYAGEEKYDKCMEVYNGLASLLDSELSIEPEEKTTELFEEIFREKAARGYGEKQYENEFFYGREKEIYLLNSCYQKFIQNKPVKACIVLGEAGVGKSKLVKEFLKAVDFGKMSLISSNSYQAEKSYALKPWNTVFEQLSKLITEKSISIPGQLKRIVSCIFPTFAPEAGRMDEMELAKVDILQYQVAERAIIDILRIVSEKQKLIMFFEDIQWMDGMSISLLRNCICYNTNIMFVITCRNEYEKKIESFMVDLSVNNLADKLFIERLSVEETIDFAHKYLPQHEFTQQLDETIINETEGNPFFLVEFLNSIKDNRFTGEMSPKMQDVLKSRILNVSEEGQKILNMAAMYFDRISFEILQELSAKSDLELADIIEELQEKYLLKELTEAESIEYAFTHQKLREFIYSNISMQKRRILHRRIANLLESRLQNSKKDVLLYSKLIYHFSNSGNKMAALKYSLKNFNEYVHVSHELFPILDYQDIGDGKCFYLTKEYTQNSLEAIQRLITEIREGGNGDSKEFRLYELMYLHIAGRNCIKQGEYENGLEIIRTMIDKSHDSQNYQYALKGYRLIIYYCINTYNVDEMEKSIYRAKHIAEAHTEREELLLLHRFEGLLHIMKGDYAQGEAMLTELIEKLNGVEDKDRFVLNIAAAYNYIGESKRKQKEYDEALRYLEKAISICESNGLKNSATVLYTNAGQILFTKGDFDTALEYFDCAMRVYDQYDYPWGRTTTLGYIALIKLFRKQYAECLEQLQRIEADAYNIGNPYDIGIVLRVKAEAAREMRRNTRAMAVFGGCISETPEYYCAEGIKVTKVIAGCDEGEVFNDIGCYS